MALHIGSLIQKRLDEVGMSKAEFGRRISKTSQTIYDIFERKTIDSGLLLTIGTVLDYDFFQHYSIEQKRSLTKGNESSGEYKTLDELSVALNTAEEERTKYRTRADLLEKEIAYLKEINELLKKQ